MRHVTILVACTCLLSEVPCQAVPTSKTVSSIFSSSTTSHWRKWIFSTPLRLRRDAPAPFSAAVVHFRRRRSLFFRFCRRHSQALNRRNYKMNQWLEHFTKRTVLRSTVSRITYGGGGGGILISLILFCITVNENVSLIFYQSCKSATARSM